MTLTIDSLYKSYGKTQAISDVSATIDKGITALIGPNGAGKSTLIGMITGNIKPDKGEILLHNEGHILRVRDKAYRSELGYMPQYPGMYPNFSIISFMRYIGCLKQTDKKSADDEALRLLARVGLDDSLNKKIYALSGGMRQRLALAAALIGDPGIIILDEPTAGLDPNQRVAVRTLVSEIALNRTVIIATHIVSDIEHTADTIMVLRSGKLIRHSAPQKLISEVNGRVWLLPCQKDKIEEWRSRFPVVSISGGESDGQAVLRILSDHQPSEASVPTKPTLEDASIELFGANI
ncbi:MAG: ATP-binding cassette domain-containing protein [Clostridia bacterium]|nr:ATP-binding cassette domain-containing protein [Clostridia bacterium]